MGNDGDEPRLEFVAQPISSRTKPDATGKLSPGIQRIAVTDSMFWAGTEPLRRGYGDKVLKVYNSANVSSQSLAARRRSCFIFKSVGFHKRLRRVLRGSRNAL